jgi:hypothetical protein
MCTPSLSRTHDNPSPRVLQICKNCKTSSLAYSGTSVVVDTQLGDGPISYISHSILLPQWIRCSHHQILCECWAFILVMAFSPTFCTPDLLMFLLSLCQFYQLNCQCNQLRLNLCHSSTVSHRDDSSFIAISSASGCDTTFCWINGLQMCGRSPAINHSWCC